MLQVWHDEGNDFQNNPWYMSDENGQPMDYISALRVIQGHNISVDVDEKLLEQMRPLHIENELALERATREFSYSGVLKPKAIMIF